MRSRCLRGFARKVMRDPRDEFLTLAAHDLKEPLRTIDIFCKLLAEEYGNRLDAAGNDYLNQVRKATKRLRSMVESLLQWGRLGAITVAPQTCDTAAMVDAIRSSIAAEFPTGSIVVEGRLPTIAADPQLLYRVLANLMHNGLHYNRNATPTVTVGGRQEGRQATMFVRDNGVGIDP